MACPNGYQNGERKAMCKKAGCIAREKRIEALEKRFKALSTCLRAYAATLERASTVRRVLLELLTKLEG